MEINNQNKNSLPPESGVGAKHYKSFWPIAIIAVLSAIVGGLVIWSVYNTNLQEDLNSLLPGSSYSKLHNLKNSRSNGMLRPKDYPGAGDYFPDTGASSTVKIFK